MLPATKVLFDGIKSRRRESLARAITLIESSNLSHQQQAAYLLQHLAAEGYTKNDDSTLRIGIAGPPGAGKSTFIEKMGLRFIAKSNKVAVIPVDPSSHISGGSILGDKTRMELLSRSMDAYIRATPTRGVLGGIAEHTSDVISLCEAAGFNTVIVESVGLGQSEVEIDTAVDMLILLVPPGGGDSLQGSKKGIMEAADLVVINKADGDLYNSAKHTKADYAGAMHFIRRKHIDWEPRAMLMSAHTGFNIEKVEEEIARYQSIMIGNGYLRQKRIKQAKQWALGQFQHLLFAHIENDPAYLRRQKEINQALQEGLLTPRSAANELFQSISVQFK